MADASDEQSPPQQSLLCVETEQPSGGGGGGEKLGLGFENPKSPILPHLQEKAFVGEPLESTSSIIIDDHQPKLVNNNINNNNKGVCDVELPDPPVKQYIFANEASPDSHNVESKPSEMPPPPPPPVAQENEDANKELLEVTTASQQGKEERQREEAVDEEDEEEEKQQQIGHADYAFISQVESLNLQPITDGDNNVVDNGVFTNEALISGGDGGLGGFNDQAPEKSEGFENGAADDVGRSLKQCEEAENQRGPPVVEENGEENKVLEGSFADENGGKWSETENWGVNDVVQVKEEFQQGTNGYYETNFSWDENGEQDDGRGFEAQEDQGRTSFHGSGTENWRDSGGGFEAHQDQGVFDNYDDERWVKGKIGEEANGYGNGDSEGVKDGNYMMHQYPLRPDAEDCSFYMKTGMCKFGPNCRFNHPVKRRNQAAKEPFKQKDVNSDRLGQTECKYHMTSGGCKYGIACRYNHSRGRMVAPILKFNFLGLPIRLGEKECPYYMRTGSCKYGSNCRFDHPDPTAVGGGDTLSGYGDSSAQGVPRDTISGHASLRTLDRPAPYVPVMYPPTLDSPPNLKWKGYQVPTYPTTERRLPTPPAFAMNIPVADTNFYAHHQQQVLVEEFPERPGQPECGYFMKTGNCMYKSGCKFHHPKNRIAKNSSFASTNQSLPFKPEQNICTHYSRYGSCKFGPACRYDHPSTYGNSTSSGGSRPPQQQYGNLASADGDWNLDSRVQQSF